MASASTQPVKKRHWFRRIVLYLAALLVLLAVSIQIVLWTDVPRRLVIGLIEKQMGLRVTAGRLSTGWLGNTRLSDVTLSLPLSNEAFLTAPRLDVSHTSLPWLMLGGKMHIDAVALDRPTMLIRQDAMGRWNVAEALQLVGRAGGAQSAAQENTEGQKATAPTSSTPHGQLPSVTVRQGSVTVLDAQGRHATYEPLDVAGEPQGLLVWAMKLSLGQALHVEGRFAPGQNWNHQLSFTLSDAQSLLLPWLSSPIGTVDLKGTWQGQVSGDAVKGRLELESARFATLRARGSASVDTGGGAISISPQALKVYPDPASQQPVELNGGAFRLVGSVLTLDALTAVVQGGNARLAGQLDIAHRSGHIRAAWINVAAGTDIRHAGEFDLDISTLWKDQILLSGRLDSSGTLPKGKWITALTFSGTATGDRRLDVDLKAPLLQLEGEENIKLENASGTIHRRGSVLTLSDLALPEPDRLRCLAEFDIASREWWLWASIRDIPLVRKANHRADVVLNANGDLHHVDVNELQIFDGNIGASLYGGYVADRPSPLQLRAYLWRTPFRYAGDDSTQPLGGTLWADLNIAGTLSPLGLHMVGGVRGQEVRFGNRRLGDVFVQISGDADAQRISLVSDELTLLEGRWILRSRYLFDDDLLTAHVDVLNLPLSEADALIAPPPKATGMLKSVSLDLVLPEHDVSRLRVEGKWHARDVRRPIAKGSAGETVFQADTAEGLVRLSNRQIAVREIHIKRGEAAIDASATLTMGAAPTLSAKAVWAQWPADFPRTKVSVVTRGDADLLVDLHARSIRGPLHMASTIDYQGKSVGALSVDGEMLGRQGRINLLEARALDGTLRLHAFVPFDRPLESQADAEFFGINLAHLPRWLPQSAGVEGIVTGTLLLGPTNDPHAPEPLKLTLVALPEKGNFRNLTLGRISAAVYQGTTRTVLDDLTMQIAGGQAHAFARLDKPENALFLHSALNLSDIDLDQIMAASHPGGAVPGRLDATFTLFGPVADKHHAFGEGQVRLRQSDLLNVRVISFLYNAMGLRLGRQQPTGAGSLALRLEAGALQLVSMRYVNRGVEVRASGEVKDVWQGGNSPVSGHVIGSARPLSSIKLPFFAETDKVLSVLQSSLTTARVEGTVNDPKPKIVPFSDISSGLRRMVVGDVQPETQGTAQ